MANHFQKQLENALNSLYANVKPFGTKGTFATRVISQKNTVFALIDDYARAYDALVASLIRHDNYDRVFSLKYIEGRINAILVKTVASQSQGTIGADVESLLHEFSAFSDEQVIHIPLIGFGSIADPIVLGPVTLKSMTQTDCDEIIGKYSDAIYASNTPEADKAGVLDSFRNQILNLRNMTCARYVCVAESTRAKERATDEVRRVLDLLRYCIPALYQPEQHVSIGIFGELVLAESTAIGYSQPTKAFSWDITIIGPKTPFEFTTDNIAHITRLGIYDVAALLTFDELDDFKQTILRGIHWFANAQIQLEPENKLTSLVTCLETFLTPKGRDPISNAVAEGVAILIGQNTEERRRIKKTVKDLYGRRSAVSHGGKTAITDSELRELTIIAGELTRTLIARMKNFASRDSLLDWVEEQKLS